jgi:hypothetical protein
MEDTKKTLPENCESVCEAGCAGTGSLLEKMQWTNLDEDTLLQLEDICTNPYNC